MFSTSCVSRCASRLITFTARARSSSLRSFPSDCSSANMRICASGVRSPWDTPEMNASRIRPSWRSRCSCTCAATPTPIVSDSRATISQSRERGMPPMISRDTASGRMVASTTSRPCTGPMVSDAKKLLSCGGADS